MKAVGSQQTRSASSGQAIITTADPHFVEGLEKVEKIRLRG
jgi:hypothetical protein